MKPIHTITAICTACLLFFAFSSKAAADEYVPVRLAIEQNLPADAYVPVRIAIEQRSSATVHVAAAAMAIAARQALLEAVRESP